jgi:hypothetical protein
LKPLVAHADWSADARKRWLAVARSTGDGWRLRVELVGDAGSLLARLRDEAGGAPVALGLDCPIGLPRAYATLHPWGARDFPAFLRGLAGRPWFFDVGVTLDDVTPGRPFYPARPLAGMTRAPHAAALGLPGADALSRACDRATAERPAGAPLFWTLGANQTGKAAIHAWRKVLIPALHGAAPVLIWPFDGPFLTLLRPGTVAVAECYPAEAMRQIGVRPTGSKRRHGDRLRLLPSLRAAMATFRAESDASLDALLDAGFGRDTVGEDRLDCVLGVLGTLAVVEGRRTDRAPDDPWVRRWEGWVLGQTALPREANRLGLPVRSVPAQRRGEADAQAPGAAEP